MEQSESNIWVVGNGISRTNYPLRKLQGRIIGCNAIHRDYVVDEIVAVDRRMVEEIQANEKYKDVEIYTRRDWLNFYLGSNQIKAVPDLPYKGLHKFDNPLHWNSGPYAVLIAALQHPHTINLLGFDLYGVGKTYNNYYVNTPNYGKSGDRPVGHSFWVVQLAKLFELYPEINFIQWQKPNWTIPFQWKGFKNLTIKEISV